MDFDISTKDLAGLIGVCDSRIRQRARELEDAGVARKIAGVWLFNERAVEVWRSWKRPAK